jgi:repressor LexA
MNAPSAAFGRSRVLGYRQQQVRTLVHQWVEERGYPPSYREICDELHIATKGEVSEIVQGLERRGELRRAGGRRRRIAP